MNRSSTVRRTAAAVAAAALAAGALAGCGSSNSGNSGSTSAGSTSASAGSSATSSGSASASSAAGGGTASGATFTVWDPYPQFDDSSDWVKLVKQCGTQAGVTVERTGYDTTDLVNKSLLAAQQGTAPNVLVVDNPVVSTLAEAGILTTAEDIGLNTSGFEANILGAGQVDGKTYGVPIGANTLALYYNKDVLSAAGVDISSVKDWDSLTAALEKVNAAGKKGITFSAIGTEEGSFQFLPWFWGSGADLTKLDSDDGISAVTLWKDWLDKGYAPNSVINNTQTTSWQEFATGDYAFAENGTWQLGNAQKSGMNFGVIPIPAKAGGNAAAPTGGEFVTVPVQSDTSTDATSAKIVSCLTSPENALTTDTTLSYVSALPDVQQEQVKAEPALEPWVEAVKAAKGRTADNLGTKYPTISEAMWNAVQAALSGGKSPADAMKDAQAAAGS